MAITPYLLYQDAGAALTWLTKAFGLRKTGQAFKDANGRVTHAEMALGDAVLLLGSPGPDFKNPKVLGQATQNLYVDVDDVAKHHARAAKAGARIIEAPQDTVYGARRYGAEDPEGHRWFFAQGLKKQRRPAKKTSGRKTPTGKKVNERNRKRSSRK